MKKKIIIAAAITGALLIAAGIYAFIVFSGVSNKHTALIKLNGEVIRTIDLDTAADETFTVESENGYNIVCIENGEIFVSEASCPDKICINHGKLRSEYLPIICLPNRLEITLE